MLLLSRPGDLPLSPPFPSSSPLLSSSSLLLLSHLLLSPLLFSILSPLSPSFPLSSLFTPLSPPFPISSLFPLLSHSSAPAPLTPACPRTSSAWCSPSSDSTSRSSPSRPCSPGPTPRGLCILFSRLPNVGNTKVVKCERFVCHEELFDQINPIAEMLGGRDEGFSGSWSGTELGELLRS